MADLSKLHVLKLGSKEPHIIMLHGWGRNIASLQGLGEILSNYATVHIIDLPGFGRSELQDENWGTEQYAGLIKEYATSQGLKKFMLLGHSFGGRISVRLASSSQDLVSALILINSHGLPAPKTSKQKFRIWRIAFLRNWVKRIDAIFKTSLFQNWFVPKFASVDYRNAGPLRTVLVKTVNENQTENAKKISCPTLLVWGEKDTETPLGIGRTYHSLIPGSELLVLPGAGHEPFADVGSHLIAFYIRPFLERLSPQPV